MNLEDEKKKILTAYHTLKQDHDQSLTSLETFKIELQQTNEQLSLLIEERNKLIQQMSSMEEQMKDVSI